MMLLDEAPAGRNQGRLGNGTLGSALTQKLTTSDGIRFSCA
jgi:hypothetical protein